MLSVTWSVSHHFGYPASFAARVIAARSQPWSNSKSWPDSPRRYGNSSLNATMFSFRPRRARRGRMHFRRSHLRRKQFPLERVRFNSPAERLDRVDKFIHFIEALMDRRVTQIRHLIDLAQFLQHLRPDQLRRNFLPGRLQFVNNFVDRVLQRHQTDRAFLARLRQTAHQLASIERLMGPVPFDHPQIRSVDSFVS